MRTARLALTLLVLAAPILVGGPRAVCEAACDEDGDDACPPSCAQACCASVAATLREPIATLLPRTSRADLPMPAAQRTPASVDPDEIFHVPKSSVA